MKDIGETTPLLSAAEYLLQKEGIAAYGVVKLLTQTSSKENFYGVITETGRFIHARHISEDC